MRRPINAQQGEGKGPKIPQRGFVNRGKIRMAKTQIVESPWMNTAEAAAYIRRPPKYLLYLCRIGRIKGHVLSGSKRKTWAFRKEDLDRSLIENSQS